MAAHALRHLCRCQRGGGIGQDSCDHFAIRASGHRLNWIITSWYPNSTLKLDKVAASFFVSELGPLPRKLRADQSCSSVSLAESAIQHTELPPAALPDLCPVAPLYARRQLPTLRPAYGGWARGFAHYCSWRNTVSVLAEYGSKPAIIASRLKLTWAHTLPAPPSKRRCLFFSQSTVSFHLLPVPPSKSRFCQYSTETRLHYICR